MLWANAGACAYINIASTEFTKAREVRRTTMRGEATSDLIMYEEDCAFHHIIVYSCLFNSVDPVDAPREFHFSEIRTPLQNTQCRTFLCLFDRTKECSRKHCQFFKKYTTKHRWGTEKK